MARDSASPLESARLLVGRYRLEEEIGRGGMGVVFRGVDTMMERPVAVKLLKASAAAEHPTTQRFLHEAKNAARIQHEHVIQVFDVGKSESGEPFFVMELVAGVSLAVLLQTEKQVPAARAVHIGGQICEALHAAHRAGIIHRDLKLANVLLIEREGQGDFVKLIDFGISRASDRSRNLTSAGETIGTIGYMAPEQLLHEPVDARTDVYAFGVLLYRLLTGRSLFREGSAASLARDHLSTVPVAPHLRAPEAAIPEALSEVVLRCLEKRPRDRYASARAVGSALRRAMDPDGAPDSAPPSSRALPPPYDPGMFDAPRAPFASSAGPETGSMSGRAPEPTIGGKLRRLDAPFDELRTPEPADSTLPTVLGPAADTEETGVGEEASLDELPPSESGSRRTPEIVLAHRQRAALEAEPPSRRAAPALRAQLPEPREPPPPSSRGSRLAQPPPEPRAKAPASLRPGRLPRRPADEPAPSRAMVDTARSQRSPIAAPVPAPPASSRAMVDTARSQRSPIAAPVPAPPASSPAAAPPPAPASAPRAAPSPPSDPPAAIVDPPSGTRLSPTGGRRSGPTFELAEIPPTVRPPPVTTGERRCAACNVESERYARVCKGCGSPLDPASQEELRQKLAAPRVRRPPPAFVEDRASLSPLGAASVLFRWAPPLAWTIFTVGATLVLVVGEVLLRHPGPAFPIALGVIIAVGVCGIVASK